MSRSFNAYTIDQFETYVKSLDVNRNITHIQIHHTWKPTQKDYKGESTIKSMWNHHVNTNEWSDIAQHFSPGPDGLIWDGRSLEKDPAGISGHNKGGIMFEIIGNFDDGHDVLDGKQLYAVTRAVAILVKKFNLSYDDIIFHREYSSKTCPGTSVKKAVFIEMVKRAADPIAKPKKKEIDGECKIEFENKKLNGVIIDGVSYAPVRLLSETLNLSVGWNGKDNIVTIRR